ncbi:MAG TPA: DUF6528 family protein [Vicinamibacterales bacterium]
MAWMNRREMLLGLCAAPFAVRELAGHGQQPAGSELVVCGWDEVFILAPGSEATPSFRKVWSWRAADRPEMPADFKPLFRTTDDCKPVDAGRRILISSSGGAVAIVERETGRATFFARVVNAHSVELLPGERLAAAASVSQSPGANRLVIFDLGTGRELGSDPLHSGHGVVWDEKRGVLWALGGDVLRAYDVGTAGAPKLERTFEIALPSPGGHDLTAIPGTDRLFVSTVPHCYEFDRERRQFTLHPDLGGRDNVKSYHVHPGTGRVVFVQAEKPEWWSEHLHFLNPAGTLRLPGERLYKARWIA